MKKYNFESAAASQRPKLFHICISKNWMTSASAVGYKLSFVCKYSMADFSNFNSSPLLTTRRFFHGSLSGDVPNMPSKRRIEGSRFTLPLDLNGGKLSAHDLHLHSK